MKKKLIAIVLSGVLAVGMLSGCGQTSNETSTTNQEAGSTQAEETPAAETAAAAPAGDKVYNIGICQLVQHEALDAATEGFQAALVEKLGEGNVNFDLQNAQGDQANCATIVNQFVADSVDLMLANATPPLSAAAAATTEIPIIGTSITDYATALEISDWSGASGRNVSGTSDLAPLEEQEKMLVELFPDAKKVGILYCSAEPNSVYQADKFAEYLKADGIESEVFTAADTNDIQIVAQAACDYADVIYIPTDNTMASATETVNGVCQPAGVPIIAGEEGICGGCGVATLSISYYDIGYKAGEMAYEILANGADISTMDVAFAPNVTKKYNKTIAEALNVTIPEDYVAIGE